MKIESRLRGFFSFAAVNALTGERRELGDFENLILDSGLERLGVGAAISTCFVGSGSTAPVVTDTGLQSLVATTGTLQNDVSGAQSSTPYFGWKRWTFRFAMGVAAGNLSEVGIGWTGGMFSRSLIKDTGGTPTTITVLSTEFLDVTYELRLYPPTSDVTFSTVIAGITHTCVLRAANVTDSNNWNPGLMTSNAASFGNPIVGSNIRVFNGSLGAVTTTPSGTTAGGGVTNTAYAANSKQKDATISFSLDNGNVPGGITALFFNTYGGAYQVSFSPAIAKDNTKELSINARYSWARGA